MYKYKHPQKIKALINGRRGPKGDNRYVTKWGHYRTAPVMCHLLTKYNLKSFIEVGSCGCQLSEAILIECPDVKVTSVDITFGPNSNRAGKLTLAPIARLKKEYGDRYSTIEKPSVEASKVIEDSTLDLVYIDASHLYPDVVDDIKHWWHKVAPHGILSGHDYGHGQNAPVKRAVDDMLKKVNVADYYNWWILKAQAKPKWK